MTREFLESLQVEDAPLPTEIIDAICGQLEQHDRAWQEKLTQAEQSHLAAMAKTRFDMAVKEAITAQQGKNHKAIAALLDLENLQKQEDISAAVTQAVAQVKKENGYLFAQTAPAPYAGTAGTQVQQFPYPQTLAGALREKFDNQ